MPNQSVTLFKNTLRDHGVSETDISELLQWLEVHDHASLHLKVPNISIRAKLHKGARYYEFRIEHGQYPLDKYRTAIKAQNSLDFQNTLRTFRTSPDLFNDAERYVVLSEAITRLNMLESIISGD